LRASTPSLTTSILSTPPTPYPQVPPTKFVCTSLVVVCIRACQVGVCARLKGACG
jgi:hypothetical protein